jgi:hypothetical protein
MKGKKNVLSLTKPLLAVGNGRLGANKQNPKGFLVVKD